jgi:hypothetical protein
MGDVFKEGVDDIYEPMAEFAVIPPPLYKQIDDAAVALAAVLSAKYEYYDDRVTEPGPGD